MMPSCSRLKTTLSSIRKMFTLTTPASLMDEHSDEETLESTYRPPSPVPPPTNRTAWLRPPPGPPNRCSVSTGGVRRPSRQERNRQAHEATNEEASQRGQDRTPCNQNINSQRQHRPTPPAIPTPDNAVTPARESPSSPPSFSTAPSNPSTPVIHTSTRRPRPTLQITIPPHLNARIPSGTFLPALRVPGGPHVPTTAEIADLIQTFGSTIAALETSHASLAAAFARRVPPTIIQADKEATDEAFMGLRVAYGALRASFGELERMRVGLGRVDEESVEDVKTRAAFEAMISGGEGGDEGMCEMD